MSAAGASRGEVGAHAPPPPDDLTLPRILEARAAGLGTRPFLVLPDARLSFAQADEVANRAANALAALGCREGATVMTLCGNGLAQVATWLGCLKLGAVFCPLNPLLSGAPLLRVMALARGEVLVVDPHLLGALAGIIRQVPGRSPTVVGTGAGAEGTAVLPRLLDAADGRPPPSPADDPGARAKVMFTSGTTGAQKGVVWARRTEVLHGHAYASELLPVGEGEGLYTCLPLSHVTAQGTLLAGLWRGARVTIDEGFRPFQFWRRVREAEAVAFTFVGSVLSTLARLPGGRGDADNTVRWALGAATPTSLWRAIEERFGLFVVETWGQTETASGWTFPARLPQRPGTVGRPSARMEAQVVGPDGSPCPPGQLGELWLRTIEPHVLLQGYLGPGGELEGAFDREGWYHTGDLMAFDHEGALSFAGRLREAIRRRGEMIAPAEIEEAALGHPDVSEAAAVGVPAVGDVEEEVLVAVVLRSAASLEPSELHRFLVKALPRFMVPRYVRVVDALPKTATTRVRKHLLAAQGIHGAWDARPGWGRHRAEPPVARPPGGLDRQ